MTPPLSLSMMKMEKNFIAHIEKKYPRKPYEEFPIIDPLNPDLSLIGFVKREYKELLEALEKLERTRCKRELMLAKRQDISNAIKALMWEVADVSNTLDYLFEGLLKAHTELEDEIE